MAMPCMPGLSPQSVWMVFSAPEMTTVSKPKRNPASADVSDQRKTRAFIEGSSRRASHDKRIADVTQMSASSLAENRLPQPTELEPPRLTVYKDIGSTMPGAACLNSEQQRPRL